MIKSLWKQSKSQTDIKEYLQNFSRKGKGQSYLNKDVSLLPCPLPTLRVRDSTPDPCSQKCMASSDRRTQREVASLQEEYISVSHCAEAESQTSTFRSRGSLLISPTCGTEALPWLCYAENSRMLIVLDPAHELVVLQQQKQAREDLRPRHNDPPNIHLLEWGCHSKKYVIVLILIYR